MHWLVDTRATGLIARRVVPCIILLPIALGWLRLRGETLGLYDTSFGTAMHVLLLIALLSGLLWWSLSAISRHEEAQRVSARRVIDTLESITDGFVTFDAEWRFTYVNVEVERLLRKSRDELLGRSAWEMFPESVGGTAHRELHRGAAARISVEFEEFNPVMQRWFANRAYPLDEGGMTVFFQDITQRKQAEGALKEADQRKDEFLATLSHELRTPLSTILGWAQVLQRKSDDRHAVQEGLAIIVHSAKLQAEMISDLLDMSRIAAGKIRLEVEEFDVSQFIGECVESVQPAADAKQISIQVTKASEPILIHADFGRLQQAMGNLLANAVKFTSNGGRIEISVRTHDARIAMAIRDTGDGMDPAFVPFVFERVRQADSSSSRLHGGLGLGLAIARQLVELHSGTIHAESSGLGQGSTFTIKLPIFTANPQQPDAPPQDSSPTRHVDLGTMPNLYGIKVLAVDDDRDTRSLLKRILEECHAEVVTAASADEALQLFREHSPHVLLSDLGMPQKDGLVFLREVRAAGNRAPAVALTAFASSEDRDRALAAGFQSHLSKPINFRELLATISALTLNFQQSNTHNLS